MTIALLEPDDIVLQDEPRAYLSRGVVYRSVTDRIHQAGFGPDFSMVNPIVMEDACRRGSMVHLACQYFNEGDLDLVTVDEQIRGYVDGYIKFTQECPIKPIAIEKKMISKTLNLGGTPDLVCFLAGRRAIIDLKTSQTLGKDAGLQTAGYKVLWEDNFPNKMIYERYGLKLKNDGTYKLIPHTDFDDEIAFLDMHNYSLAKDKKDKWNVKY